MPFIWFGGKGVVVEQIQIIIEKKIQVMCRKCVESLLLSMLLPLTIQFLL